MTEKRTGEALLVTGNEHSIFIKLCSLLEELNIIASVTATPLAHQWDEPDPSARLILIECIYPCEDPPLCKATSNKPCPLPCVKLGKFAHVAPVCTVEPNRLALEQLALQAGLHGIFYYKDPIDKLVKGVRTILSGELWFRRVVLRDALCSSKPSFDANLSSDFFENIESSELTLLTRREKEVLMHLCSGATNQEIAMRLYVSPHTVKYHIYRIYKKTASRNRAEVINWAKRVGFF